VEPTGLEPVTPCLQSKCATNCAMAPRSLFALVGGLSRPSLPAPWGVGSPKDTIASLIIRYDGPVYPERRERIQIGAELLIVTPEEERTSKEERLRAARQHVLPHSRACGTD
jgi:hypothetical protein